MTEQEIRKIVQEEIEKEYRAGDPHVPTHHHDGTDNIRISQSDIIPLTTVNGTIDMASATTYSLYLSSINGSPSSVTFYGGAKHPSATKQHSMIIGNAQLGINQQFQPPVPANNRAVTMTGSKTTTIIQGSAFMYINNTDLTKNVVGNSQGHIIYTFDDSGTDLIVADITAYSNSVITINVSTLASGWTISGLWIVT